MTLTTKEFRDRMPATKWVAVVAAVLLLVLVVAAVKGCGGDDSAGRTASGPPSESAATSAKGSVLPQKPELQRSPNDPDWLTAAPDRVSWQRVDGIPFPFSVSDGPSRIHGAVTAGYSHTPQGAVLAAAHITFRLAWSPDYQAVLDAQTQVSDETRQALTSGRDHSGQVDAQMVAAVAKAPVAFRVADYNADMARVYLAFPTRTGTFRFAPASVAWVGGDWKYTDDRANTVPQLPDSDDLDGFTLFGEEKR